MDGSSFDTLTRALVDLRSRRGPGRLLFATQGEAQRFFNKRGGPREDPYRLDSDNDGVACVHRP